MHRKRSIAATIRRLATRFPAILLTGPRQVGKTTCLRDLATDTRTYVTLDDPQARLLAKDDPRLFLQRHPAPLLIDEIQYAPELLPLIKIAIDEGAPKGSFWLTGSQQFQMMAGITESLAGRIGIVQLLGFSSREREDAPTAPFLPPFATDGRTLELKKLYRQIWRGSFPAFCEDPALDREVFFGSYVQTYIQRDVRALTNIGDELSFTRFLRATAARSAQLLNLSDLARDADIAPNTAKKWLSVLRASGLIHLLEPYHSNRCKRMVKSPKLYFLDTGLGAYLTRWSTPETLESGAAGGAFFETWAVGEILKSLRHHGKSPLLYHYRDDDQREIDLILELDGHLHPIEIKKTTHPHKDDIRHFSALNKLDLPVGAGAVLCLTPTRMPIVEGVDAINVGAI